MTPETPREAQLLEQNAALRLENEALQRQIQQREEQIAVRQQKLEQLEQLNAVLQLKVDAMARKLFGRSSEKLSKEQMQLVFDALQPEELQDPETLDHAPKVTDVDPTGRPRVGESLRRQRDAAGGVDRDRLSRQTPTRSCHGPTLPTRRGALR